jgi:predicted small lipoprotein YifL
MRTLFTTSLLLVLLVATTSCGTSRRGPVPEGERTTVEVRNQNFLDMNVYVLSGSQRIRLGTVNGLSTRTLTIPRSLVFGFASVRFEMNPIGSRARPVSQEITVSEGGQIVLTIPNW